MIAVGIMVKIAIQSGAIEEFISVHILVFIENRLAR